MPSIPQSLLWISLVVLWLFVLVPMLINKRETVRRTSDVALATRVLDGEARSRLVRRGGPATGHRHDPDWQRDDDFSDELDEVEEYDEAVRAARSGARSQSAMVMAMANRSGMVEEAQTQPVYLDVDVVDENSGALPVGSGLQESLFGGDAPRDADLREFVGSEPEADTESIASPAAAREPLMDSAGEPLVDLAAGEPLVDPAAREAIIDPVAEPQSLDEVSGELADDTYEYIDDTSGLEVEEPDEAEADAEPVAVASRPGNRQRRLDTSAAAAVSARKYRFRMRVLITMSMLMVGTAVASFAVNPGLWWAGGATAAVTVLYLAYLRRQTRIEAQIRRQRQQRTARSRPVDRAPQRRTDRDYDRDRDHDRARDYDRARSYDRARNHDRDRDYGRDRDYDLDAEDFPSRLSRPGSVVLDIDDEDPVFEHLDEVAYSRRHDLPRAAGQ